MIWDPFDSEEYLPPNDNAWLRMDHRTNRMVVTGVLSFDEHVTYGEIKQRFEDRLTQFDRFRQRINEPWHGLRPRWEEDSLFDIDNHLSHVALPEPQGVGELQDFVGDIMDEKLDDEKPLWHCWLVEGVAAEGDGNALVVRIHHALADGFALLYVLFSLADDPDSIELPIGELPPLPNAEVETDATEDEDTKVQEESGDRTGFDLSSVGKTVLHSARTVASARDLPLRKEPETPLKGKLSGTKRVSWTDTYDLDEVKSTAHSYDATVNDVLMASIAGAFRRYIEEMGHDARDSLELTAAMPVNLKPLAERDEQLGNYFGLGFVELPVGVKNPKGRVLRIQKRTGVLKQGAEAYGMYALLNAAGSMPDLFQENLSDLFRNRVTAAITNVPGPMNKLELAGTEVTDIMFWAPTTEDIGIGISIFSYGGGVRVGVAVDKNIVSNPNTLAEAVERDIEDMLGAETGDEEEKSAEADANT